ncbi:MAG TPA: methylenetetrahydrofolate reductase [Vicinamibacterales bacterium]|nr:methylenetetrahydrofolate reductase [Vicinamibacterales bacterium]
MDKQSVRSLVAGYSIETTVREAARIDRYQDLVPKGTSMYIPHVPGVARTDTIALAARLRKEEMDPVPHIVARRTESAAVLDDFLNRLVGEAGVTRVLCVAGDIAKPEGEFESALQILERGFIDKHGIKKIGVAGHPEGHKDVSAEALKDAIVRKNAYAKQTGADLRLVTQFSFVAEPVIAWDKAIAPINTLPIFIGLPGLAKASTLLKYALDCGVGPSLQAFSKHATQLSKLLTVSAPDEQLVALANYRAQNPQTLIQGLHFFPFGGLKRTTDWLAKLAAGEFEFTADGGLNVPS